MKIERNEKIGVGDNVGLSMIVDEILPDNKVECSCYINHEPYTIILNKDAIFKLVSQPELSIQKGLSSDGSSNVKCINK